MNTQKNRCLYCNKVYSRAGTYANHLKNEHPEISTFRSMTRLMCRPSYSLNEGPAVPDDPFSPIDRIKDNIINFANSLEDIAK